MSERHQTLWLFHATAMVADYNAAFAALDRLVGLRVVYEVNAAQAGAGYRGGVAEALGNIAEAQRLYRHALELNPQNQPARDALKRVSQ